jgi:hypothetical protein
MYIYLKTALEEWQRLDAGTDQATQSMVEDDD